MGSSVLSLSGSFPATPNTGSPFLSAGISIADYPLGGSLSGWNQWTPGAAAIAPVTAQPSMTRPWTILSWSLEFQLYALQFFSSPAKPAYGKLGRLIAGLVQGTGVQTTISTDPNAGQLVPWKQAIQPPPADQSLMSVLFDGSQDGPPPAAQASNPNVLKVTLSVSDWRTATFSLPQPLQVEFGQPIAMGMWLTPSLAQNASLIVMGANYNINVTL